MLETFSSGLQEFVRNVRIVDILDIALISFVFYLLINWLIRSISKRTLIGFSLLFVIYIVARLSGMYLTELLIQGLFIVILIGLVVVFQSDIRRIVDRIGNWKFFSWDNNSSYSNSATDIITEAVSRMAEEKVGALIVIRGEESWDRHIDGGIKMEGKLSIPLLRSIFNPNAPGHDGAVLIEGDTIVRFGTHLPLSKNMGENFAGGTRHAAALGLSERSDALVIVASEERGTVSIAQRGVLRELDSTSQLKNALDDFWNKHYQNKESTFANGWKAKNIRTAIASVTLAAVLWFAFAYQTGTVYRSFSVPIEYRNLQANEEVVQESLPMQTQVTLAGPQQAFRSLNPPDLVITFNLEEENLSSGELIITENHIEMPNDLQLYDVNPRTLDIKTKEVEQVTLPIKIPTVGSLPNQLELTELNTDPDSITINVQLGTAVPDSLTTEPVDLSEIEESTEVERPLVLPSGINLPEDTSRNVTIAIKIQEKTE